MLLNPKALPSIKEIKPDPTKHLFGVGARELLYVSVKRAGSEELRNSVTLFVVQGEDN